jgi:hypothetical protein
MDAIIGRYKVRLEESGLILTYGGVISFELTPEETLGLFDFINVHLRTLNTMEPATEPRLERVVLEKDEIQDEHEI